MTIRPASTSVIERMRAESVVGSQHWGRQPSAASGGQSEFALQLRLEFVEDVRASAGKVGQLDPGSLADPPGSLDRV